MAVGILPSYVVNGGGGGSGPMTGSLSDLSDVSLSSPVSAQVLTYGTDGEWHNQSLTVNPVIINLQSQISDEVTNRQLADQNLQRQINEIAGGSHVVFSEEMTGNGIINQFQLTGAITNGEFISGSWQTINVMGTLAAEITDVNGSPIYDGGLLSIFTRHKITVDNINVSGLVTTDYIPLDQQVFKIWYWYDLQATDRIDNYYRDDIVTKLESADGDLATNIVANVVNFNKILGPSDNTVQKALETLDDHSHSEIVTLQADVISLSGQVEMLDAQVSSLSGNFVHLSGNESISGSKNFVQTPTVSGSFDVLHTGNAFFEHHQSVASTLWTINHNLNRHPSVTTTNDIGTVINGTVKYINNNTVTINFTPARTGYAYLN